MGSTGFSILVRRILPVLVLTLACGAARADTFSNGQFVTYAEDNWGGLTTNPGAQLLIADYATVYMSTSGALVIGLPNTGVTMTFLTALDVISYLPASGNPAPLTFNSVDPISTPSGEFGGDVLALRLDVDFNNAGFIKGTPNTAFGSLVLQNITADPNLDGLSVSRFLADATACLGSGSCIDSPSDLNSLAVELGLSFDGGTPSTFAQTNLALPVPEPSTALLLSMCIVGVAVQRARDIWQ